MTKSTSDRTVRGDGLGARRSDNAHAHTVPVPVIDRILAASLDEVRNGHAVAPTEPHRDASPAERVGGLMGVLVVNIDADCKRVLEPQGS